MKKTITRMGAALLALVLAAGTLPAPAGAREALSWTAQEQSMDLAGFVTGGGAASLFSSGSLPLAEGNHPRWIDRLADVPEYASDLYAWMEENADGDGSADALIQVETAERISGYYAYEVASFTESIPFEAAADADDDTVMAAGAQAANGVIEENMAQAGLWVSAVTQAFDRDHGEVFWLSGSNRIFMPSCQIRFELDAGGWKAVFTQRVCMMLRSRNFDIRAEEYRDETIVQQAIWERDHAIDRILSGVTGVTRQEQLRQINRWLTENNGYNTSMDLNSLGSDARNCYGALMGSAGRRGPVCEGYARAFQTLCKALGIPCVLVDGVASNGTMTGGHMWNYVQMEDGKWYAVDVTWNDPGIAGVTTALSGYEREDYLLCGGETVVDGMAFMHSHPVSNTVSEGGTAFINGPVLSDTAYVFVPGEAPEPVEPEQPSIVGAWETDIVFPAADLGVQAPDIVFRCKLTFGENGTVTADWEPVELSAIRLYFHTLFVNAYYACAYGAGITSFEAVEQYCLESTGMGVREYMDAFLDGFDMAALFRPESTQGTYRLSTGGDALYTDLRIMEIASDPQTANGLVVSGNSLEWTAASYGMADYVFVCTKAADRTEGSAAGEELH